MRSPLVEEVRARRKELLDKEYEGSVRKFIEAAQKWEQAHPERMADLHELHRIKKAS
jgi:hypothetical protein